MAIRIFCAFLFLQMQAKAQTADSIDNIVFKVNKTWKPSHSKTYKQFTFFGNDKGFCQLTIYGAQPASGNKVADFTKEWNDLISINFPGITMPSPASFKTKSGTTFLRSGGKASAADGNSYYVQLNVYDCGNTIQSVIAVSGTQKQLQQYDTVWQKLITGIKKNNGSTSTVITPTPSIDKTLVGTWSKSSSSPPAYINGVLTNTAYAGYSKGEYNLKDDGSYTYQGERMFNSTKYHLIDETGSFNIQGNTLTLIPSKSLLREVNGDGILKASKNLSLNKRVYTWQRHYYEGIQENSLVLGADKENPVDGGYSESPVFTKAFIYSPGKKLEFRFLPHKF